MAGPPIHTLHALYGDFLERGIVHFFPDARLAAAGAAASVEPALKVDFRPDGDLVLDWFGMRYVLDRGGRPFTEQQIRLVHAIGDVLSARYRSIFYAESVATTTNLFRGLPEDRFVSAFLDHDRYLNEQLPESDVIADAVDVLRESSLVTYENRRVSTGVLLLGPQTQVNPPESALPYNNALVASKSFHRLSDGLNTVYVVNRRGLLVGVADIRDWSRPNEGEALPAPTSGIYLPHTLATLHHGHICLVLTPNGEIKVFAAGVQVFGFLEGRWRLTDAAEKHHVWQQSVGDPALAERILTVALNMAERRRGGLFVVLDDGAAARELVAPGDLVSGSDGGPKTQLHYLLRNRRVLDLEPTVLESIARVDGGIVVDRGANLLAFGAILRTAGGPFSESMVPEGGRTTAAISASRFGCVLKISEDGPVSFYRAGAAVWEI